MAYSVGVEYSLHSLVYLINIPPNATIGIKDLAEFQGVSETYLSKMFGRLAKAGIVDSVPGVKGGYRLAKAPESISFWDVIEAVEGSKPIFQCKNVTDKCILVNKELGSECLNSDLSNPFCFINQTMLEVEEKMRLELRQKSLKWLNNNLNKKLPETYRKDVQKFFNERSVIK